MKSYYEIADIVYSNTIIATDADDVATMLIESEGNFNQAMVKSVNNMLHGAGVVPLDNNKVARNKLFHVVALWPVVSTNNSVE
jgi:hypothetical protein